MKKRTLVSLTAVAALLTFNVAFATTNVGQTIKQEAQQKKEEVKTAIVALRHAKAVAKCDIITAKIDKKIENFNNQKEQHVISYNKTKDKIQNLITRLEGEGLNVAKLKQDLVLFDEKIEKFVKDYQAYISLLESTKEDTCGKSEGDFKAKLKNAREQLKVVHDDAVEIRTFYAKTIRPDFLAIKLERAEKNDQITNDNQE